MSVLKLCSYVIFTGPFLKEFLNGFYQKKVTAIKLVGETSLAKDKDGKLLLSNKELSIKEGNFKAK